VFSYHRMCSLTIERVRAIERVLVLQNVFSYRRHEAPRRRRRYTISSVFSYHRTCSRTIERVLVL